MTNILPNRIPYEQSDRRPAPGSDQHLLARIQRLNQIGIALSALRDPRQLLERILDEAKSITESDAGTIYLLHEQQLVFEILRTDSLGLTQGGAGQSTVDLAPIPLLCGEQLNDSLVVAYCANHKKTINITDAYSAQGFDFSGTRHFDQTMGYRSISFLAVPMLDPHGQVIGVLQLINKQDPGSGVLAFDAHDQQMVESLASQAAVALSNTRLMDELKQLFEAFIQLIATAIDEKSPYTGAHCRRVPELTMMIADKVSAVDYGPFGDFRLTDEDRYALQVAAWLHDCGKITTPEFIVDKATKLETIYDRIGLVDTRFEVLKRDARIHHLELSLSLQTNLQIDPELRWQRQTDLDSAYQLELVQLEQDQLFLQRANIGSEWMSDAAVSRIEAIAERYWQGPQGDRMPLLSQDEVNNLSIRKGTLTAAERDMINHHISMSIKMLQALPFPSHLRRVPEFAGGHHERMDGRGYPNGLHGEQMSVPARVMAIADIFEALTAKDRPYKNAKTLSESLSILDKMQQEGHIDPDLYDIFVREKVYLDYAHAFLDPAQIDIA